MPDFLAPALIVIAVLVIALLLMWLGWRRRSRAGAQLTGLREVPAGLTPIAEAEALYVATTEAGRPLERVAVPGLGFRARASLSVAREGVTIAPRGEAPVFIPADRVLGALPATWTIDRVVERDGLIALSWRPIAAAGATEAEPVAVDSYVRVIDQAAHTQILEAIAQIAATDIPTPTESEITA